MCFSIQSNLIMEDVKRSRGRPKGSKNVIQTDSIKTNRNQTGIIGRPTIYGLKDEDGNIIKTSKTSYENRGFLVNRILGLKRTHKLAYPDRTLYVGKPNDVVIEILKTMMDLIQNIKIQNAIQKLEDLKTHV